MEDKDKIEIVPKTQEKATSTVLDEAPKAAEAEKKAPKKSSKTSLVLSILGGVFAAFGATLFVLPFVLPKEARPELSFPIIPSKTTESKIYSNLTGEELASETEQVAPAYCVQIPNGMDGARPQAGLDEAGVIFEAIAEAGITRFAAIFQDPGTAVIGPIRSLRLYYLQWDTPFDCTIVHAGGADDALAAVKNGGYRDLTENYTYMYRGTAGARRWNNLFTTAAYLSQMNSDRGYGGSNIRGFKRMTPEEALVIRVDETATSKLEITEAADGNTSALAAKVAEASIKFGGLTNFNVKYSYNASTDSYDRKYESGAAHDIYDCPDENLGEKNPENVCTLKVLSPKVVVAISVEEKKSWDNYHEDITTIGSGEAFVFQGGYMLHGTWRKDTVADQIKFYDDSGVEIALAPGQTIVEAVPSYGSVAY